VTGAIVYVHRTTRWCVLRAAHPGGRITTLCSDWFGYERCCVSTVDPGVVICPACATELAAGTPGAAVALDPVAAWDARYAASNVGAPPRPDDDAPGPDAAEIRGAPVEQDDLLDVPVAPGEVALEDMLSDPARRLP